MCLLFLVSSNIPSKGNTLFSLKLINDLDIFTIKYMQKVIFQVG